MIEEIYKMYSRKVFLFLLSKTNNEDIAEELTQETFFQAVQCIDKFKGNSSILTWLCGIAKNVWLKDLRKRQKTVSIEDNIPEITNKEHMDVQWEQKEILQLIHGMDEPVREVMYLRLISNLTFAEIGEIIGKTENWTRVTFYRGKQKIVKEILKRCNRSAFHCPTRALCAYFCDSEQEDRTVTKKASKPEKFLKKMLPGW